MKYWDKEDESFINLVVQSSPVMKHLISRNKEDILIILSNGEELACRMKNYDMLNDWIEVESDDSKDDIGNTIFVNLKRVVAIKTRGKGE